MPQPFEAAVMTADGEALLTKATAGDCRIEYVRIAIGNGSYTDAEKTVSALKERKSLKSEKNSYTFSNVAVENEKCVMLTALLTNQDPVTLETLVTAGYYINEVGIFAKEAGQEDSAQVLYSICVTASATGNGDYMPPYSGENRAEITQNYIIAVDNSANITVNVEGTFFLAEDAVKIIERQDALEKEILNSQGNISEISENLGEHISNKCNPHNVKKEQVGLSNVDNTADIQKPVSIAQQAAIDAAYANSNYYTDEKIAGLINGAPTTLDTLKEIADAMKENESVVDALQEAIGKKANESEFDAHISDKSNPHNVTKGQVGLGNVPNVKTNDQTPTYSEAGSLTELTSGEKLSVAFGKIKLAVKNVISIVKLLGTTDISAIGDGTVTGALSAVNRNLTQNIIIENIPFSAAYSVGRSWASVPYTVQSGYTFLMGNAYFAQPAYIQVGGIYMSSTAINVAYDCYAAGTYNGVVTVLLKANS